MSQEHNSKLENLLLKLSNNKEEIIEQINTMRANKVKEETKRNVFKSEEDAKDKFTKMVKLARLPIVQRGNHYIRKGKNELVREFGFSGVQIFDNNIRSHVDNGVFDIIETYVNEGELLTDKVREMLEDEKFANMDMSRLVSLLENYKVEKNNDLED